MLLMEISSKFFFFAALLCKMIFQSDAALDEFDREIYYDFILLRKHNWLKSSSLFSFTAVVHFLCVYQRWEK